MFRIICDSSCDIREYAGIDFEAVPVYIYNNDHFYYDNEYLNIPVMMEELENYGGRSFTSGPSAEAWMEVFSDKKENYVITLTGGMSGTYNSACLARNLFLEDYPSAKIVVFDSLSTGPEMKMAVDRIVALKKEGKSLEEISEDLPRYLKSVRMFLAMNSTNHLLMNGRIDKIKGNMNRFRQLPVLAAFTLSGKIEVVKQFRGKKKVVPGIVKKMEEFGYEGGKVRITYAQSASFALKIGKGIREKYEGVSVEYGSSSGLCSYYLEWGGVMIAFETGER